ncbi:hypothetical protein VDIAB_90077 [Vibrio diabolicus]|nr:hypothetical protein VDIAB_90077 [Vibrio diabolicus]
MRLYRGKSDIAALFIEHTKQSDGLTGVVSELTSVHYHLPLKIKLRTAIKLIAVRNFVNDKCHLAR